MLRNLGIGRGGSGSSGSSSSRGMRGSLSRQSSGSSSSRGDRGGSDGSSRHSSSSRHHHHHHHGHRSSTGSHDSAAVAAAKMMTDGDEQHTKSGTSHQDDESNEQQQQQQGFDTQEDPLVLAVEDLMGRVITSIDAVKTLLPTGLSASDLAAQLRPIIEVVAHTAPSVARTYFSTDMDTTLDQVYEQLISDLVLPSMLEFAQSDPSMVKRTAALEFFCTFFKECQTSGSWLDMPKMTPLQQQQNPLAARRRLVVLTRESECLRYWMQASIACTTPGAFTSSISEDAVASRGVLAASLALRPAMLHICQRIQDIDNRGALKVYLPLWKMTEGVMNKLFSPDCGHNVRSTGVKFLELLALLCSKRGMLGKHSSSKQQQQHQQQQRGGNQNRDFALEDLPEGHEIITHEALEAIADYAFNTLRGFLMVGGQVHVDDVMLQDATMENSPTSKVTSLLKGSYLAYLSIESNSLNNTNDEDTNPAKAMLTALKIPRSNLDFDFLLAQKPYSITINAIATMATHRPSFYKEAVLALARRAVDPPQPNHVLTRTGALALSSHLRACCLTLLRNALSVTSHSHDILQQALYTFDMHQQADKALAAAKQTASLKTAGRAARYRAQMHYEWDVSSQATSKRKRETDDALAKIKAAKAARGLGNGIQLPSSMVDAMELVLVNLAHLPSTRPTAAASSKKVASTKRPITLDYVVDAIMTNSASLSQDEGRWYERDGGTCWSMNVAEDGSVSFSLDEKILAAAMTATTSTYNEATTSSTTNTDKEKKAVQELYVKQCRTAASQAIERILSTTNEESRDKSMVDFGNKVAAKLAWTLSQVQPSGKMQAANENASESIHSVLSSSSFSSSSKTQDNTGIVIPKVDLEEFVKTHPLVASCLNYDLAPSNNSSATNNKSSSNTINTTTAMASFSPSNPYLPNSVLNEAFIESRQDASKYERALDLYVASVVHASDEANKKPTDMEKKRVATLATASLAHQFNILPSITPSSLRLLGELCNIADIYKRATETARKNNVASSTTTNPASLNQPQQQQQQPVAVVAALNAAKLAAEKRALAALVALRDVAFQRSHEATRKSAVDTVVAVATGQIPSSPWMEDKALKLCINVLYTKSESHSALLLDSASRALDGAADYAIANYERIQTANDVAEKAQSNIARNNNNNNKVPISSDEEKQALEKTKKPAVLYLALCIRKPELLKHLFTLCSKPKADVLAKAARETFFKVAKAVANLHGDAAIALQVAAMTDNSEVSMLLAFLDHLAAPPVGERSLPSDDLIKACHQIQDSKLVNGKKDARFIIPISMGMKRVDLVSKLPEFVAASDTIFMAALVHMSSRLVRHALVFREEDEENPILKGMTLCEALIYLHKMDFSAHGIPQKRYLDAIRLCLEDDGVFTDTVVKEALNYMSGTFLTVNETDLPLAYMRTIILTCSKHETLHNWICHVLLPRLVEARVYQRDKRQWEGWMRCARMMEKANVEGIQEAIHKLPPVQLQLYRTKYPTE